MSGYIERVENKRASENGWVEIKDWGTSVNFYWGFKKIQFKLYTYVVDKTLQNGTVYTKTNSWFKNHIRNFSNFRQALQSPKSWNSIAYFYPKNTFLQLKHYIQKNYLILLSTTRVKICQIPYFWNYKSFFTAQLFCIFFGLNITYFLQKYPIKVQIFRFTNASIKIHQIPHLIFQAKSRFFFKFWVTLQCHEK